MGSAVTVSTMFTDLVDSTAAAARLGPEAAEELRRDHFALLRSAVSATGGTEVKGTGDGLMVVFPHWLEHFVEVHGSDTPRISIPFNAIAKTASDES